MRNPVDIKENEIIKYDSLILPILLMDNSSGKNIIWATDDYVDRGKFYSSKSEIKLESITGENGDVIKPRVCKTRGEKLVRVRSKAEVFTPLWICNKQNNLVDSNWFGKANIFNLECDKSWISNDNNIPFPTNDGKTWQDYVKDIRLEICCGEAPYLVSRYDAISGKTICLSKRIGLLDRKLRVISENVDDFKEWCLWTKIAFQSIYGYEWQGDNLLLARENLLFTCIDYFTIKFDKSPPIDFLRDIAKIISWNIWQMDGLKGVIPYSCRVENLYTYNLFGDVTAELKSCEGCLKNNIFNHNGIYCKIKDWRKGRVVKFVTLLK